MEDKSDMSTLPTTLSDRTSVTTDSVREGDGHRDILRQNHLFIMKELHPQLFMDMLDSFLKSQIHEKMTKEEMTRQLLQNLSRGPVEMFDEFCKVIAGLNPDVFQKLQGREPTREESDFFFKSFYKDLRAGIIRSGSRTDNEIDRKIDLDTQFVNLKLTDRQFDEGDNVTKKPKLMKFESMDTDDEYDAAQAHHLGAHKVVDEDIDMAEILPQDFSGKSVLLQGRAGVGKSTLTQYVAREWAKGRWGASFTGVFLLNLRKLVHVHQKLSLSELLGMYAEYVTGAPDPDKPSVEWLEQNAERVLIFADGIDELPELGRLLERTPKLKTVNLKATPLDWCINLIQKNVLPQCTTVVVSRPFIGLRKLKYDREIEVFGLSPDMVMQFVERNVESSRKEAVKETLSKNPLLLSVCTITFYCAAICKVLEQDSTFDSASLTTYTRIAAYITTKFVSRNTAEECALSVLPQEFSDCVAGMASLAYHGLLKSGEDNTHLVFDQTDFNQVGFTPNQMKAAKQTGLLLYKDVKTPHSPQLQAEFVHLSVQEFLAMASLAMADELEVRQFFKSSLGRFNMSKLFAFGLFLDKNNLDIQAIYQAVMRDKDKNVQRGKVPIADILVDIFQDMCKELDKDDKSWLTLMHIAHESQSVDLALTIGNMLAPEGEFELTHRYLTLIDLKAIFFCLTHADVQKLTCSHIIVDHILAKEISQYLEESSEKISLEFKSTNIKEEGMIHLAKGIKSAKSLDCLQFLDNDITDESMKYLSQGIAYNTSLSSLAFLFSEVTDEGFRHLSEGVRSTKALKCLKLGNTHVSDVGLKYLANGIERATSIASVCLQAIDFSASSIQSLCEAMGTETTPKQLHLEDYVMNHDIMKCLAAGFKKATKLKHLVFNNCDFVSCTDCMKPLSDGIRSLAVLQFQRSHFSNNCMDHLTKAISRSSNMQRLTFKLCVFRNGALETLSEGIAASSSLTHVEFLTNSFTEKGVAQLVKAVRSAKHLKSVRLEHNQTTERGRRSLTEYERSTSTD